MHRGWCLLIYIKWFFSSMINDIFDFIYVPYWECWDSSLLNSCSVAFLLSVIWLVACISVAVHLPFYGNVPKFWELLRIKMLYVVINLHICTRGSSGPYKVCPAAFSQGIVISFQEQCCRSACKMGEQVFLAFGYSGRPLLILQWC